MDVRQNSSRRLRNVTKLYFYHLSNAIIRKMLKLLGCSDLCRSVCDDHAVRLVYMRKHLMEWPAGWWRHIGR